MEVIMKTQPMIPSPEVNRRLIDNLRQARLDFAEVDLQLEELVAKFDELIRQQKLERIKHKQQMEVTRSICEYSRSRFGSNVVNSEWVITHSEFTTSV
jgi:hypothetical protein